MTNDRHAYQQQKIAALEKECASLRRELSRLTAQQLEQERIDNINKNLLKETNEQLLQCNALSQRENISKSDFLANMSHEIRTPLNIILGMANLLAETELDTVQMQYLTSLRVTGRQLMEILNNILEFSRIDAGKITVEPEPFSLHKIIQQIEASALPLCLQKKLKFHVDHDPLLVMERIGDALKIFQILLNLINNAVKFTRSGTITFAIKEDYTAGTDLIFAVIDTGIGISEDQQENIFDRFTQTDDSLSQQQGGAGLGLAISEKLTNAMGGKLRVKSALGKGSIFSCHLPLPPAAPSERRRLRLDASLILPEYFPDLKILVVDDVVENIEVIKMYLKEYPVHIQAAANGQEALDYFADDNFNLILMDVRMPVMDGITATKEIRRRETENARPAQVILAVTAYAFQEQKNKFLQAGFDGVLTKPYFKRELIQALFKFTSKDQALPAPEKMGNKAIGYCLENDTSEKIPESFRNMVPDLLQTISSDLNLMKSFLQDGKYENIYATAHSLKGVAGMFGFQKLASLITDLAQTIKAGDAIVADELFAVLDIYVVELHTQFT
jgi:signal transduction histidine kinase/CheY-like chemotaxis protein